MVSLLNGFAGAIHYSHYQYTRHPSTKRISGSAEDSSGPRWIIYPPIVRPFSLQKPWTLYEQYVTKVSEKGFSNDRADLSSGDIEQRRVYFGTHACLWEENKETWIESFDIILFYLSASSFNRIKAISVKCQRTTQNASKTSSYLLVKTSSNIRWLDWRACIYKIND